MSDSEAGWKWWIRYVIVPLLASGGVVAIFIASLRKPSLQPSTTAPQTSGISEVQTSVQQSANRNKVQRPSDPSPIAVQKDSGTEAQPSVPHQLTREAAEEKTKQPLANTRSNDSESSGKTQPVTDPQPKDSSSVNVGQFLFSIEHCRILSSSYNPGSNVLASETAGKVECYGTVTNTGSRRASLDVDDRQTNIVDNLGHQSTSGMIYNMSKSVVSVGRSRTLGPGGTVSQELEPYLPLVFAVSGIGLDESATSASIILVTREGRAVIRNLRIQNQ